MSNDNPVEGRCNAKTRDGGHCSNYPVDDAERCRMHGGKSTGPPEGTANAETHNMTSDASKLYKRLPDDERELVDGWKRSLLEDAAEAQGYAGVEDFPSYYEPVIHRLAMNMLRMTVYLESWQAGSEMKDDVDNPIVNRSVVGRTETGEPLFEYSESVVENAAARMSRENRQWLKDLEIIDTPESDNADSTATLAEAIKNATNSE